MDVSKLPRLSNTPAEQQANRDAAEQAQQPQQDDSVGVPLPSARRADETGPDLMNYRPISVRETRVMGVAEAWISLIVGLVCIMIGINFARYTLSRLTGTAYHTEVNWTSGPLAGQEVKYPQLEGFVMLNDSAIFLFGLTLLFDAAVIGSLGKSFRFSRHLLWIAFLLAVAASVFNVYVSARLLGANVIPLISMLAVAFGGYIAMYQWKMLHTRRSRGELILDDCASSSS